MCVLYIMAGFHLYDDFLGPLRGKEYCAYFGVLMAMAFVTFVITLVSTVLMVSKGKMKLLHAFPTVMAPGLMYFSNRLLYSMCVGRV